MKRFKKWYALIMIPFLCLSPVMPVSAGEVDSSAIDFHATGSLTIEFPGKYDLVGSEYAIWLVADLKTDENGVLHYYNRPEFRDVHFKWTDKKFDYWDFDVSDPIINFVGTFIDDGKVPAYKTVTIGSSNKAVLEGLPLGMYYVRQIKKGSGNYSTTDFLISIPMQDAKTGKIIYDVNAEGKTEPTKPDKPDKPNDTDEPEKPQGPGENPTDDVEHPNTGIDRPDSTEDIEKPKNPGDWVDITHHTITNIINKTDTTTVINRTNTTTDVTEKTTRTQTTRTAAETNASTWMIIGGFALSAFVLIFIMQRRSKDAE